MPDSEFEEALGSTDQKPSTSGIIKKTNGDTPKAMDPDALWLWDRLRDFERRDMHTRNGTELIDEMTPAMAGDVHRLLPTIIRWLKTLEVGSSEKGGTASSGGTCPRCAGEGCRWCR